MKGTRRAHRLLFSGDLGQPNQPILKHYEYPQGADIVLLESTYADRLHPSAEDVEGRLKAFYDSLDYIFWHEIDTATLPQFAVPK